MDTVDHHTGHGYDLDGLRKDIAGIVVIDDPALVKQKSRDFYWYSPVLKERLRRRYGDLVVVPRTEAEVLQVLRACVARRIPLTVRGAGTGNYGQAMPLEGGVILEMTALDRIRSLADGIVDVEVGKKLIDLEMETLPKGWEMRFHPSTRRTATIGGFVAGGSTGVGAINYGLLRDRGTILSVRVATMEDEPRILTLRGDDVFKVTHAYGCNGVITSLEMALAPAQPWADVIVAFDDFDDALVFSDALARSEGIVKKLITPVAGPAPGDYFRGINDHFAKRASIVLCMIAVASLRPFETLVEEHRGDLCYRKQGDALSDATPLYEYTWNHTTLQALKVDRSITYLQTLFGPGVYMDKVRHMREAFGDEVLMHLEFVRLGGEIACFGLQLVRYTTEARLREIIAYHEDNGCPVFDPHTYILEDGGMKQIDEDQLAFKRQADPHGLMNPGKMRAWWEGQ